MRTTTVLPGTPCVAPRTGEPPLHRLELAAPGAAPFAAGSFDEVGPLSRTDHPHRHTFYEIVHVTAGSGTHVVDLAEWPVRPPQLAVVLPGQIHCWRDQRGLDGTLALFTEDFLVDHPGDRELLRRIGRTCWFDLDPAEHARTGRLMAELAAEHRQRAPGHESVLRALLHVLVVRAARLPAAGGPSAPADPGGPAVADAFVRLAARREAAAWSVRECAERLGVTAGHLSQSVRAATGRSPRRLLIEARVHQAQRLLAHTDLPVRQVAARVGYADPAYFCRFFRRETGRTPGEFRKHHSRHRPSIEAPQLRA
ncbi:AraC family transcriptional regulator [Streptomyces bambusae]|uniref:AraC family transcriptional regulator n=1 Tax=Streptomyces bambusae TaxID=1550616 RepID=UPI001CFCAA09|nr:AraC family transcriptional regulator [Streptomyces bambusae]MCB5165838.1 AraC family transcriptional regulator [Streptomyces bambusae]